jgi:hypothetical protein
MSVLRRVLGLLRHVKNEYYAVKDRYETECHRDVWAGGKRLGTSLGLPERIVVTSYLNLPHPGSFTV